MSDETKPESLTRDEWMSQFMNRSVWKVSQSPRTDQDLSRMRAALQGEFFAYAKVSCNQPAAVERLENLGFHLIDTSLQFERPGARSAHVPDATIVIREAMTSDKAAVVDIAFAEFKYSRFHLDRRIPVVLANRLKAEWAGNYFAGKRGHAMVVAEVNGTIAGFVQLLRPKAEMLVIDLIAVGSGFQGQGIAQRMIEYCSSKLCGEVALQVGTQVANVPSVRLYEKLGFRLFEAWYVLHAHGT